MSQALVKSFARVAISTGPVNVARKTVSLGRPTYARPFTSTCDLTKEAITTNPNYAPIPISSSIVSKSISSIAVTTLPYFQTQTGHLWNNPVRLHSTATASSEQEDDSDTVIATGPDGKRYAIPLKPLGGYNKKRHAPKLAPSIVKRRINKLRTVDGKARNIRHSPWRLNLICQFAAGQTVDDVLLQLKFVEKVKAPLVASLIQGTANNAKVTHGLRHSQLEVAECYATHGTHLKRVKFMGRGRVGKKLRRHSHMRVVLREIDFPLKIMTSTTKGERERWVKKMNIALEEAEKSRIEQEEIEELEREVEEMQRKNKEKESK